MMGQVLRRDEDADEGTQDPHEVWYRFNGRQIGFTGNNGTLATDYATSIEKRTVPPTHQGAFLHGDPGPTVYVDFDQSLDPITSWSQGSAGGSYTVREGDTLAGLAAQMWGDASLWYKIAEANGMAGNAALVAGQVLAIPVNVLKSGHNAATFRPYDPLEALGQTSPTNPKPNKSNRCGAFGAVLLTVVSLAVSLALPVVAPGIFAACGLLGSVGGAVAASMIGSAVSQGVGLATGIQDQFSWKSVAIAGLSAAVGGGLGKALGPSGIAGSKLLTGVVRGAVGSALSQGVAAMTGLQPKFDWAGVAAAGLGGGVSSWAGDRLGALASRGAIDGFAAHLGTTAASTLANAAARSLVTGTSFGDNLKAALPDAIGSTIGNILAETIAVGIADLREGGTPDPVEDVATGELAPAALYFEGDSFDPASMLTLARSGNGLELPLDTEVGRWLYGQSSSLPSWMGPELLRLLGRGGALGLGLTHSPGGSELQVPLYGTSGYLSREQSDFSEFRILTGEILEDEYIGRAPRTIFENVFAITDTNDVYGTTNDGANAIVIRQLPGTDIKVGFGVSIGSRREAEIYNDGIANGWSADRINAAIQRERAASGISGDDFNIQDLRASAGTAFVSGSPLADSDEAWLSAGMGFVPGQVAARLSGRSFDSFDDFRRTFWRTVADEPALAGGFGNASLGRMRRGLAPYSARDGWHGRQRSMVIHHQNEIQFGGSVYDMSNMVIMTPKYHNEIHYGPR